MNTYTAATRNYVDKTPMEYMQARFRRGFDEETPIATRPCSNSRGLRACTSMQVLAASKHMSFNGCNKDPYITVKIVMWVPS